LPSSTLDSFTLDGRPTDLPALPRFLSWAGGQRPGILAILLLCSAAAAEGSSSYTVRPGDTAYSVARQAGTDVPTLLRLNNLTVADLKPGQVLKVRGEGGEATAPPPSSPLPRSHRVEAGQTLYAVARLYGLKAAEVQDFNHLSSADLRAGQVLLLPQGAGPGPGVSVAVPARPAAPPVSTPTPASAPTARHTVQPGQTLYSIARSYNLRAADLLTLNQLNSPDLRPGQALLLPAGTVTPGTGIAGPALPPPGTSSPMPTSAGSASPVPTGAVFSPGVPLPAPPPSALPSAPPRRSDVPGGPDQAPDLPIGSPDAAAQGWRGLALSFLGVPYVYGGKSRSGTDCSGLVVQVFGPLGLNLPRQSALQAQVGTQVELPDLQPGDLLFFDTEGRGAVTHVGIYLGSYLGMDGAFINANSYGGQVAVNRLSENYFAQRYLWARRVLGTPSAQSH
jgi:peptidoglycan DL-endopeptidase LytE